MASQEACVALDRLVFRYLSLRHFNGAAAAMSAEAAPSLGGAGAGPPPPDAALGALPGNLLLQLDAHGDARAYGPAFDGLAAWVDGSLDLYWVCGWR